jgi:hypothetical protein
LKKLKITHADTKVIENEAFNLLNNLKSLEVFTDGRGVNLKISKKLKQELKILPNLTQCEIGEDSNNVLFSINKNKET